MILSGYTILEIRIELNNFSILTYSKRKKANPAGLAYKIMPRKRFELSLSYLNSDLNAARLPIPPSGHVIFNTVIIIPKIW